VGGAYLYLWLRGYILHMYMVLVDIRAGFNRIVETNYLAARWG